MVHDSAREVADRAACEMDGGNLDVRGFPPGAQGNLEDVNRGLSLSEWRRCRLHGLRDSARSPCIEDQTNGPNGGTCWLAGDG